MLFYKFNHLFKCQIINKYLIIELRRKLIEIIVSAL